MGKVKEWLIVLVVLIAFVVGVVFFAFMGVKNVEYNYIKLEVNPKVEFITDKNNNIISVFPINKEAKELIVNENFVGMSIWDGSQKFVDLCVQANYIDVETKDNAVKLTVVSGLTEMADVKIYRAITKYFLEHEINCVIIENENDLQEFNEAKKYGVSANKFALMESVCNFDLDLSMKQAKELTEKELINKIKTAHELQVLQTIDCSEELNNKAKLIDFNRAKLNHHKENITTQSVKKFADEYKQFVKGNRRDYKTNFNGKYEEWKRNKINTYLA